MVESVVGSNEVGKYIIQVAGYFVRDLYSTEAIHQRSACNSCNMGMRALPDMYG